MLENSLFVNATVSIIASAMTFAFQTHEQLNVLWFFIIYAVITDIHLCGTDVFFKFVTFNGILALLLVLLFCIGSMTDLNMYEWAFKNQDNKTAAGLLESGSSFFMKHLVNAS